MTVMAEIIRIIAGSSRFSKVEILHLYPLSPPIPFEPYKDCLSTNPPCTEAGPTVLSACRYWDLTTDSEQA